MLTIQRNNKKSLTVSKSDLEAHIGDSDFVIIKLENAKAIERFRVFYQQERAMEKEPKWFKNYRKTDDQRWEENNKRLAKIETIIEMLLSFHSKDIDKFKNANNPTK